MLGSRGEINDFDWRALVHDVRAGLQSLDAAARLGLESASEQVRQAALQDIAGGVAALEWQLSDLLEGLDARTTNECIELDLWAAATLRSLASLAEQHGKRLLLDTSPGACALLCTDPASLSRVLQNLVVNAIRYSESESIIVELGADGRRVQLSIRNAAGRLTSNDWGLVTAPGARVDEARHARTERRLRGSGLGVTIANALAGRLGGACQVKARPGPDGQLEFHAWASLPLGSVRLPLATLPPGHGAVLFDERPLERAVLARQLRRLGWPVRTPPGDAARLELHDPLGHCRAAVDLADPRFGQPATLRAVVEALLGASHAGERLLLVDDNDLALAGLMRLAAPLGFTSVRHAHDVAGALRLAEAARFDHAIIDLRLGTSSGRALAERLRARVGHTVLISADASGDVRSRPSSSAELSALLGRSMRRAETEATGRAVPLSEIDHELRGLIERLRTSAGDDFDLELHSLIGACQVWGLEALIRPLNAARSRLREGPSQALEPLLSARSLLAGLNPRQGSTADD